MNLHLGVGKKRCELFPTPTAVTYEIMGNPTKRQKLLAYFVWVQKNVGIGTGQFLDHQIQVLWFVIENPEAEFYEA